MQTVLFHVFNDLEARLAQGPRTVHSDTKPAILLSPQIHFLMGLSANWAYSKDSWKVRLYNSIRVKETQELEEILKSSRNGTTSSNEIEKAWRSQGWERVYSCFPFLLSECIYTHVLHILWIIRFYIHKKDTVISLQMCDQIRHN